mmetsp:Transcript_48403/g.139214  ORF Transcript_48403/g.139214 Transcript_48403/m.139214 type:complete len:209 (-) Transcript_48403:293-919(-)
MFLLDACVETSLSMSTFIGDEDSLAFFSLGSSPLELFVGVEVLASSFFSDVSAFGGSLVPDTSDTAELSCFVTTLGFGDCSGAEDDVTEGGCSFETDDDTEGSLVEVATDSDATALGCCLIGDLLIFFNVGMCSIFSMAVSSCITAEYPSRGHQCSTIPSVFRAMVRCCSSPYKTGGCLSCTQAGTESSNCDWRCMECTGFATTQPRG